MYFGCICVGFSIPNPVAEHPQVQGKSSKRETLGAPVDVLEGFIQRQTCGLAGQAAEELRGGNSSPI